MRCRVPAFGRDHRGAVALRDTRRAGGALRLYCRRYFSFAAFSAALNRKWATLLSIACILSAALPLSYATIAISPGVASGPSCGAAPFYRALAAAAFALGALACMSLLLFQGRGENKHN